MIARVYLVGFVDVEIGEPEGRDVMWLAEDRARDKVGELLAEAIGLEIEDYSFVCRGCGCTNDHACEGGCSWVELDLCSVCAQKVAQP